MTQTLLSSTEVALLAGASSDTVRIAARRGRIVPAVRAGRGQSLYTPEEAARWSEAFRARRAQLVRG